MIITLIILITGYSDLELAFWLLVYEELKIFEKGEMCYSLSIPLLNIKILNRKNYPTCKLRV
jgi:hypothetical protein